MPCSTLAARPLGHEQHRAQWWWRRAYSASPYSYSAWAFAARVPVCARAQWSCTLAAGGTHRQTTLRRDECGVRGV
ncbi:hypothetical protein BCR44DRAFT_1430972, partial [Catenaria anguillulae PL171]